MRGRHRGDGLHGLDRHRGAEVHATGDRGKPEAKEHALGIEAIDRDVSDDERNERSQIAEGAGELGAVEDVAAYSHAPGANCWR